MFPRSIQTSLISLGIALSMLAVATGPASARPADPQAAADQGALAQRHDNAPTSSLAGTTSAQQDLRSPDARDAATPAIIARAKAQEQYYTSYGQPQPIQAPGTQVSPESDVDWLPIAFAVAAALLLAGIGVTTVKLRRRRVGAAF